MTKKELLAILNNPEFPDDMLVLKSNDELGGYTDIPDLPNNVYNVIASREGDRYKVPYLDADNYIPGSFKAIVL
jgi:hypothetical protein